MIAVTRKKYGQEKIFIKDKMKNKIKFMALDEFGFNTQQRPYPASQKVPDWWKGMSPYSNGDSKLKIENGGVNHSFKKCTPMLDALTSGYIVPLWTDVLVSVENNIPSISWKTQTQVFGMHGTDTKKMDPPPGYSGFVFKYISTWQPITPPGYSSLIVAPFGYKNLPLQTISAVIDTDKSTADFSVPMWIKDNFEGIIEKETPLVQIIPFKRDSWISEFDFYRDNKYQIKTESGFNTTILNYYTKNIWSKKEYR